MNEQTKQPTNNRNDIVYDNQIKLIAIFRIILFILFPLFVYFYIKFYLDISKYTF